MDTVVDIFIAYSHDDRPYKDELKKFLRPLLNAGQVSVWDDYDIEAGKDWEAEIKKKLYSADIILLLVSPDSLASDYFYGKEVATSLERHERGEAVVVPVILRPCLWERTPISKLEALPAKAKPVIQWPSRDEAFTDVAQTLAEITERLLEQNRQLRVKETQRRQFTAAVQAADHLYAQRRWVEARKTYADAAALWKPEFEPSALELQNRQTDCDKQAVVEKETAAFSQRRAAYDNAIEHANQLHVSSQWSEARAAWLAAQRLYEPTFSPQNFKQRIAECDEGVKRDAMYNKHIENARRHTQSRAWAKAAKEATSALLIKPGDEEALHIQQLSDSNSKPTAPTRSDQSRNYLIWGVFAVLTVGILITIAIMQASPKENEQTFSEPKPQVQTDSREENDYLQARQGKNIPAWRKYLDTYPNGKYASSVQREISALQTDLNNKLNDAMLFIDEKDYSTARDYLKEALAIWPDHPEATSLMKAIENK